MTIDFSQKAKKQFLKFDKQIQKQIKTFINKLKVLENPRSIGKPLVGNFRGFWRYRVGDYRLICKIEDKKLIIVIVEIDHRKNIYN